MVLRRARQDRAEIHRRVEAAQIAQAEAEAGASELRNQLDQIRAEAEAGWVAERAHATALRDQVSLLQVQLATAEAEAKAVNDRVQATGEQLAAAEQRAATERERADRLASSVCGDTARRVLTRPQSYSARWRVRKIVLRE